MDQVTAGTLFQRSGRLWMRHYVLFTLLGSLAHLPAFVLRVTGVVPPPRVGQVDLLFGLSSALSSVLAAAVAHGVVTELRGKPLVFVESLRIGLRSLGHALGAAIFFATVAIVGSFAYHVPALAVQVLFFVAVPVMVIERPGFVASFVRAFQLARDHHWTIVGAALFVVLVELAIAFVASLSYRHGRPWTPELRAHAQLILMGAGLLFCGWWPVLTNVAFHDLRRVKEGVNVATLTDVFA
jgi:hypothetical protein